MKLVHAATAILLLLLASGVYSWMKAAEPSCGSTETSDTLLSLLQRSGRINFVENLWAASTAEPQFARLTLDDARAAATDGTYRCHGTISAVYNAHYITLLREESETPLPDGPLDRRYTIDFTPSRSGPDSRFSVSYALTRK